MNTGFNSYVIDLFYFLVFTSQKEKKKSDQNRNYVIRKNKENKNILFFFNE